MAAKKKAAKKAAKGQKELRLHYDATAVESADNGDTTYFGGMWSLNGEEHQASGDDRSDNYKDKVVTAVLNACDKVWPKEAVAEYDYLHDIVEELVEDGPDGAPYDLFTFVAKMVDGKLEIWGEATPKKVLEAKSKPAKDLGDLLGDLLANHLGEHEDELSMGLAESIAGCELENAKLQPTEEVMKTAMTEVLAYLTEAVKPMLRKALTEYAQTAR